VPLSPSSPQDEKLVTSCLHCGKELDAFELPDAFDHEFDLACFNDECPYYVRGWTWMEEHYAVKASYRYRIDARTGFASPLPVWSETAIKDRILSREAATPNADEAP
jgi:hypothetical protein